MADKLSNTLSDHIANLVKVKTLSNVVTDANGGFYLGTVGTDALTTQNSAVMSMCNASLGSGMVAVGGQYNNYWYAQARDLTNGGLIKNTNIGTVYVFYIGF
jgi:hypothetical protein